MPISYYLMSSIFHFSLIQVFSYIARSIINADINFGLFQSCFLEVADLKFQSYWWSS